MTKTQYTQLRTKHEGLNSGQFLAMFISKLLDNMALTLVQISSLGNIDSKSSFQPNEDELYKYCLESLELGSTEKADTLISLLKRLPDYKKGLANFTNYFIVNGEPVEEDTYRDSRVIGNRNILSFLPSDNDKCIFSDGMTDETPSIVVAYGKPILPTPVYKTKATESPSEIAISGSDFE